MQRRLRRRGRKIPHDGREAGGRPNAASEVSCWLTTPMLRCQSCGPVSMEFAKRGIKQEAFTGDRRSKEIIVTDRNGAELQDRGASVHRVRFRSLQRLGLHDVTNITEQGPLAVQPVRVHGHVYNLRGCHKMTSNDHQEASWPCMKTRRTSPPPGFSRVGFDCNVWKSCEVPRHAVRS